MTEKYIVEVARAEYRVFIVSVEGADKDEAMRLAAALAKQSNVADAQDMGVRYMVQSIRKDDRDAGRSSDREAASAGPGGQSPEPPAVGG